MKVILLAMVFVAALNVCAGGSYDEKQTAVAEIERKFQEVLNTGKQVTQAVQEERKNVNKSTGEAESVKHLNAKMNNTKYEFHEDAKAVIRTAIVQSKPMTVIYCIRNVTYSGDHKIKEVGDINYKKVMGVKTTKLQKVEFDEYAVDAITSGLRELVQQSKSKIQESAVPLIQALKKEAIAHCDSAKLLLGEIEVCVQEPLLSREYVKVRQEIERSLGIVKKEVNVDLENCLTKKNVT